MFQLSWGKLRREPATRWFDRSFAPIPTSDERFARQYRYELPPEFPLASPCAGIAHHLSGPNNCAQPRTFHKWESRAVLQPPRRKSDTKAKPKPRFHFHFALEIPVSSTRTSVRLLGPCFKTGGRGAYIAESPGTVYVIEEYSGIMQAITHLPIPTSALHSIPATPLRPTECTQLS